MTSKTPSLRDYRFDFSWFVLPGIVAVLFGLGFGLIWPQIESGDLSLWVLSVLAVDVAHVYATLYRTYADPKARIRYRNMLIGFPILCGVASFVLHQWSPLYFWRALAYLAIFHFIKQHVGFALLYTRAGNEQPRDRDLAKWTVWAGTLAPVIYWHAHLPRRFNWFVDGDLIAGAPKTLGTIALVAEVLFLLVYVARRIQLRRSGHRNPLLDWLVLLPAVNWTLGMVIFNDDRVFTITNVIFHGVPYFGLVWLAGGKKRVNAWVGGRSSAVLAVVFYGLLLGLAYGEEALWHRLVWHERPLVFGTDTTRLSPLVGSMVVALLTIPQATHYLLDRWIWRVGPRNPELGHELGLVLPPGNVVHRPPAS